MEGFSWLWAMATHSRELHRLMLHVAQWQVPLLILRYVYPIPGQHVGAKLIGTWQQYTKTATLLLVCNTVGMSIQDAMSP